MNTTESKKLAGELDQISREMILVIDEFGGECKTPILKSELGVDDTGKLTYRVNNKLNPERLVMSHRKDGDKTKTWELLPLGTQFAEEFDESHIPDSPSETRRELKKEINSVSDNVEDLTHRVETIEEKMDAILRVINDQMSSEKNNKAPSDSNIMNQTDGGTK